tara:strand:+ start:759 stop:1820 length:1062 start_codon:yes stop_codon:yes gene_type:complete
MKINFKKNFISIPLFGALSVLFALISSPVKANTYPEIYSAETYTFVPGKSAGGIRASMDRIEKILENHPDLVNQAKNELLSYRRCSDVKYLEKEKQKKETFGDCTSLYRSLLTEKIWFNDEILWKIVNYTLITKPNKEKETCYNATLLGTGKGIKCFSPKIKDPKTGEDKKYIISCSREFLSNKKIRADLFNHFGTVDINNIKNRYGLECGLSAKIGSEIYRGAQCYDSFYSGVEDAKFGIIIGRYCRDSYPDRIEEANKEYIKDRDDGYLSYDRYSDKSPIENRKIIQDRIRKGLIEYELDEKLLLEEYRDFMSEKYSKSERKEECIHKFEIIDYSKPPIFYREYCNKLLKE